jgi:spore photoproduct lyase
VTQLPIFSHIYIEDRAREYPLTSRTLAKFPKATNITIQNYKEVFNRPRQRWDHQKTALKLILAVRDDAFLYPGSSFVPSFDHTRFFYTTPVLNCLYGCEYCYLQGMFPSANLVLFVNSEDFIKAAERELAKPSPSYLCISYDTDLLALEEIFGYCAIWIEFARMNPHVTLEIRTKSAHTKLLRDIPAPPNVILAWTLSPERVISSYEHKTPGLDARLKAIRVAQQHGWRVRVCYDPVLKITGWQDAYSELIMQTMQQLSPEAVHDFSIGVFRIPSGYLRAMQDSNPSSKLVHYPYTVRNSSASYTPEEHQEIVGFISQQLAPYVPQEKICPVPWQL